MSHKFPTPTIPDHERQRLAANWIASGLGLIDKARELLEGRSAGPCLAAIMRDLKQLEHELRTGTSSVELIEEKPPTVLSL